MGSGPDTRSSLLSNISYNQGQTNAMDEEHIPPTQDSPMDVSQIQPRMKSGLLEPLPSRRKRKSMGSEGLQEQSSPSLRRSKRIKISVPLKDVDLEW
ncbi:1196_t:CDS:1, partial [Acaulospora colombiana]